MRTTSRRLARWRLALILSVATFAGLWRWGAGWLAPVAAGGCILCAVVSWMLMTTHPDPGGKDWEDPGHSDGDTRAYDDDLFGGDAGGGD